jgi:hypothetical protein
VYEFNKREIVNAKIQIQLAAWSGGEVKSIFTRECGKVDYVVGRSRYAEKNQPHSD